MQYRNRSFAELKEACAHINKSDFELVEKAFRFSAQHSKNKEQEAHQANTAFILASLGLDAGTIAAALTHEILFDSPEKKTELEKALDTETAGIVEDIARLKSVKNRNYGELENQRLAKVIMGIAKDFRSLFVEIASQLDKMRKIQQRPENKRESLAELVQDVYAPIAHKLGLYEMEWEIQDLALKYFKPKEYEKIKALVGEKREQRERNVKKLEREIGAILGREKISASVSGRAKNFNSIYKKMFGQNKKFGEMGDLYGARIICNTVEDCYRAIGLIHLNFRPIGEYDDYIANPKKNNYQSIHTVIDWHGRKAEVQARTMEMHRNAEEGLAAHWRYKHIERDRDFDQKLTWVKQFVEWQRKIKKTGETMRSLKLAFGEPEIFVLSPKKEIITLPEGSTALDFAYAIHSDIGNKCASVTVNEKISPLHGILESGDVVEVNTSKKTQCKPAWLNIVKTEKAKTKIRKTLGIKSLKYKPHKAAGAPTTASFKKTIMAKCCNPLPGDKITGYRTTKRKITIHAAGCPLLALLPEKKKIGIEWGAEEKKAHSIKLTVRTVERAGILIDLLSELERQGATIGGTETKSEKGGTIKFAFDIRLKDAEQFQRVRQAILSVPAVIEAGR
ncbi:MAG: HD domain-containing protein [Candidatus Diapherotrites archaeon]|nr:HD domain-containing protein [Candidatus Diapherotrites archaeon]